ncbi:MAG: 6-carboxytetrahydropterin synthase [Fusobacteriaceae bacterium]
MRSLTKLNIQYSHRFLGFDGEAQYLHGHTGNLVIEVAGEVNEKTGFVFPCNSIKSLTWDVLKNFDHALILQENDPLLPSILDVYAKQGIKDGVPSNRMVGVAFENELAKAYPECRLVVVKKVATCENLIEVFYSLLKDKLNIKKMTFASGDNCASEKYSTKKI